VALDLREESPLLPALVHPGLRPLRTTYEGDFGQPLGDIYFFPDTVADGGIKALHGAELAARPDRRSWSGVQHGQHGGHPTMLQASAVQRVQQGLSALCQGLRSFCMHAARGASVAKSGGANDSVASASACRKAAGGTLLCFPRHWP